MREKRIIQICKQSAVMAFWFMTAFTVLGCGSPKIALPVQSLWNYSVITADGNLADWTETAPQYDDRENRTSIWVSNDAASLCLRVSVNSQEIVQQLTRSGFFLSLETEEKDAKPFSLKVEGSGSFGPAMGGPKGQGPPPEQGKAAAGQTTQGPDRQPHGMILPKTVVVSYPYSSGPMIMSLDEARDKGLALGIGNHDSETWTFEAVVRLDAVFFENPPPPASRLSVIFSSEGKAQGPPSQSQGGMSTGGNPPGGGKSGGGPGNMKGKKRESTSFKAVVDVILTDRP